MTRYAVEVAVIGEKPGRGRLGRHVEHDERSRAFSILSTKPLVSRSWTRHGGVFEQGDLGSCTGNAMGGLLMTEPHFRPARILTEADCVTLYEAATRLDSIPGHYPPDDTGSSGIAVARAAQRRAWVGAYHHAFGLQATLAALSSIGPVIIGMNWYEGFDSPIGADAELRIAGEVRGGHEVELLSIDVERKLVHGANSWGDAWGAKGFFALSFDTLGRLLAEQGDVVVPLPVAP